MHALRLWATALLGVVTVSRTVQAAPCGRPDLVDMVPPNGASGVPLNATLGAHYASSAEYLGEDVVLARFEGSTRETPETPIEEQTLVATFDPTEGLLAVTPPAPLAPEASYLVRWPALRGLNAAATGSGAEARFTTGTGIDGAPPTFAGVVSARWDVERRDSDCTDSLEERMVFDLELGAAEDDGGRAGLTLLLFQTAGPHVSGGSVPVSTRALPPDGKQRVSLTTADGVGEVCFAGVVRDSTGQVSDSGSRQACLHTIAPPFFRGCSLSGDGEPQVPAAAWLIALVLAIGRARRS